MSENLQVDEVRELSDKLSGIEYLKVELIFNESKISNNIIKAS